MWCRRWTTNSFVSQPLSGLEQIMEVNIIQAALYFYLRHLEKLISVQTFIQYIL